MNAGPVLRKRIQILAASLIGSGLLAGLYHSVQTPQYLASAEFVLNEDDPPAENPTETDVSPDHLLIATQRLTGDLVLEKVIESLPEVHQLDWKDFAGENPRDILRENLELRAIPGQNAFRISCRSRQPETAVVILEKIFESTQKPLAAGESADSSPNWESLAREHQRLQNELESKGAEWTALTREFETRFGNFVRQEQAAGEPGRGLYQALDEARRKLRAAQTHLVALEESVRNGWEPSAPRGHEPQMAERDRTTNHLPQNQSSDPKFTEARKHQIALEARLQDLLRRYGPAHSRVREVEGQIRRTEDWLGEQKRPTIPPVILVADHRLASQQITEARAHLQAAKAHEEAVRAQYEFEQSQTIERENHLALIASIERELQEMRGSHAAIAERMRLLQPERNEPAPPLFAITVPPEVPGEPSTPNLTKSLCVFQGIGLLLGLGMLLLHERRSVRHRIMERFAQSLHVPMLGGISELSATGGTGLDAVQTWARLHPSETAAFESLRTQLEIRSESASLFVTSGTLGEGKTTVAANLAVEFAQAGKKTLLIDADLAAKGLSRLLELDDSRGLSRLLLEETPLAESARKNIVQTLQPGLVMLPAGPELPAETNPWNGPRWREFLSWAERVYDQILIDAPAVHSEKEVENIARAASGVLLVINSEGMPSPLADEILKRLDSAMLPWLGIIANRVRAPFDVPVEAFKADSNATGKVNADAT